MFSSLSLSLSLYLLSLRFSLSLSLFYDREIRGGLCEGIFTHTSIYGYYGVCSKHFFIRIVKIPCF
jgi:hypothetical protein